MGCFADGDGALGIRACQLVLTQAVGEQVGQIVQQNPVVVVKLKRFLVGPARTVRLSGQVEDVALLFEQLGALVIGSGSAEHLVDQCACLVESLRQTTEVNQNAPVRAVRRPAGRLALE